MTTKTELVVPLLEGNDYNQHHNFRLKIKESRCTCCRYCSLWLMAHIWFILALLGRVYMILAFFVAEYSSECLSTKIASYGLFLVTYILAFIGLYRCAPEYIFSYMIYICFEGADMALSLVIYGVQQNDSMGVLIGCIVAFPYVFGVWIFY
eukprot:872678_1